MVCVPILRVPKEGEGVAEESFTRVSGVWDSNKIAASNLIRQEGNHVPHQARDKVEGERLGKIQHQGNPGRSTPSN